jgi:hypothetical protein
MKATRMYKRRERRRAKRETTNGGMILNGEQVLTMRLVFVFVFRTKASRMGHHLLVLTTPSPQKLKQYAPHAVAT